MASTLPEQIRYNEQGYAAVRPVYPTQIYYDPTLGPVEYSVDPSLPAHAGAHAAYPPLAATRGSPVNTYSQQTPAVPSFHPPTTTPPVPQAAWTNSPIAQPFYGQYGGMPAPPGSQHAGQPQMAEDLAHGRSVYIGHAPHQAWSASPVIPAPYQFFPAYQGASPRADRLETIPQEAWTPSTGAQVRPAYVPHASGANAAWMSPPTAPAREPNRQSYSGPSGEEPAATAAAGAAAASAAAAAASAAKAGTGAAARIGPDRERKEYHPQPPARRSEWVMWVGNVPSNVSHEELWRFFNTTVPTTTTTPPASTEPWRGPSSIFLISRSSCAFVNFSSQADLDRAVPFFNGLSLRPWDPRCPRMVCRVRRKDDDLRAGVGAQRGVGMHRSWIEQHRHSEKQAQLALSPKNTLLEPPEGDHSNHDSSSAHKSSASFASTNSSFLAHHFPKRYFILKSLTTSDLEECVKTGLWKTQRHNQPILDQAFRTSQEVILIFGANRSGEFYGYAKMIGPSNNKRQSSNILRSSFGSTSGLLLAPSPGGKDLPRHQKGSLPAPIREEEDVDPRESATRAATDPYRLYGLLSPAPQRTETSASSPGVLTDETMGFGNLELSPKGGHLFVRSESPDMLEEGARRASTLDPQTLRAFERRESKPTRLGTMEQHTGSLLVPPHIRKETFDLRRESVGERVIVEAPDTYEAEQDGGGDSADPLAPPFRLQWIKVGPLSFSRTRHLRNPWNGDREVKVSRDGTEVEPGVGAQLLAEWDRLDAPASGAGVKTGGAGGGGAAATNTSSTTKTPL
ncbi:hypothetical protein Q8F55_000851 [Vanrija albida]|uniref:YTH domain-containing protein n=1 Tax=Vanrija albida TaxID=181172 RepID=A0ABR3QEY9_9TREE